jgi:hypothetical protein
VFLLTSRNLTRAEKSKENYIAAMAILNHAIAIVDYDEAMALKLFNQAKRMGRI